MQQRRLGAVEALHAVACRLKIELDETCDIAFVFDNTARCENMTGNGPAAKSLAAKVSDAWINFARGGDPNHSGLPRWKPFDPADCGTMVFDNDCAFREHLDDETQALLNES